MSGMAQTMEMAALKEEVRSRALQCSMYINLLDQIAVALEEDDPDEALRLAKGEDDEQV